MLEDTEGTECSQGCGCLRHTRRPAERGRQRGAPRRGPAASAACTLAACRASAAACRWGPPPPAGTGSAQYFRTCSRRRARARGGVDGMTTNRAGHQTRNRGERALGVRNGRPIQWSTHVLAACKHSVGKHSVGGAPQHATVECSPPRTATNDSMRTPSPPPAAPPASSPRAPPCGPPPLASETPLATAWQQPAPARERQALPGQRDRRGPAGSPAAAQAAPMVPTLKALSEDSPTESQVTPSKSSAQSSLAALPAATMPPRRRQCCKWRRWAMPNLSCLAGPQRGVCMLAGAAAAQEGVIEQDCKGGQAAARALQVLLNAVRTWSDQRRPVPLTPPESRQAVLIWCLLETDGRPTHATRFHK